MLLRMAIRMKEWGMLSYPRQGVQLPTHSLNDWARSGQAFGQGLAGALQGSAELAAAMQRVSSTGSEADIAARLESIARETADELRDKPVRDWDYSWQQAYEPRLNQMLSELDTDAREQARRMSPTYSAHHSLRARRESELERIRHSRRQWQDQVESAVQRGDAESARRWLEQGREVFVPASQLPQQVEAVESRSLSARWHQQVQQNPAAALTAWQAGDAARPSREEDLRPLQSLMEQTRSELRAGLALQLAAAVEQGAAPDEAALGQAATAGVFPQEWLADYRRTPQPLAVADTCDWLRRIDERAAGDDDRLVVQIALAPIPVEERRLLLRRVQATAALPPEQRAGISRTLWSLYHEGHFGCPGDAAALRSLGRLQDEALQRQQSSPNAKDLHHWLESLQGSGDHWLCYQPE